METTVYLSICRWRFGWCLTMWMPVLWTFEGRFLTGHLTLFLLGMCLGVGLLGQKVHSHSLFIWGSPPRLGIQPAVDWKYLKKILNSFTKQSLNLPHTNNSLYSVSIVFTTSHTVFTLCEVFSANRGGLKCPGGRCAACIWEAWAPMGLVSEASWHSAHGGWGQRFLFFTYFWSWRWPRPVLSIACG